MRDIELKVLDIANIKSLDNNVIKTQNVAVAIAGYYQACNCVTSSR